MKFSKGAWRRIGIISAAVFCFVLAINFAVLFKIYGCAGASFSESLARQGICSDQGLKTVQYMSNFFQGILWISLIGTIAGFAKSSGRNK